MKLFKRTLVVIGVVQLVLGVAMLVPDLFQRMMGLDEAPEWVNWLFAMFGARAVGFGYGMLVAARNPAQNMTWIRAMIGVQAIDWVATLAYLATGAVTLAQVTTAAFLPVVFIVILSRGFPTPYGAAMNGNGVPA